MQVDFEGAYPIEGAKEVSTLMTRHVSRALRAALGGQRPAGSQVAALGVKAKKPLVSKVKGLMNKVIHAGNQAEKDVMRELPWLHLQVAKSAARKGQVIALSTVDRTEYS
jgi:hypothetical protein